MTLLPMPLEDFKGERVVLSEGAFVVPSENSYYVVTFESKILPSGVCSIPMTIRSSHDSLDGALIQPVNGSTIIVGNTAKYKLRETILPVLVQAYYNLRNRI